MYSTSGVSTMRNAPSRQSLQLSRSGESPWTHVQMIGTPSKAQLARSVLRRTGAGQSGQYFRKSVKNAGQQSVKPSDELTRTVYGAPVTDKACGALDAGELADVPVVRARDAVGERNRRRPAEPLEARDVEQFARCSVGLGRVVDDLALVPHDVAHELRQFRDAHVLAASDVHDLRRVPRLHQENT